MTNDELRTHAKPLPVVKMVECVRWCRPVPRERCEDCAFCVKCSPLQDHVMCAFVWAWKNDPIETAGKVREDK